MVTPAAGSARRQGVQDLGHPPPFPGSAAAAPAPRLSLVTPASGAPRGADPGPHPRAAAGAAAGNAAGTPAPRLAVQLLPRDAAAAARVAAAGGNPHLELDCKCALLMDGSKRIYDMHRRAGSLHAILFFRERVRSAARLRNTLCSGRQASPTARRAAPQGAEAGPGGGRVLGGALGWLRRAAPAPARWRGRARGRRLGRRGRRFFRDGAPGCTHLLLALDLGSGWQGSAEGSV